MLLHIFLTRNHQTLNFREKTRQTDVHTLPDPRAGEGVPLQQVPHKAEEDRDCPRPVPDGEADQDLVPEQEDEVEKGKQGQAGGRRGPR